MNVTGHVRLAAFLAFFCCGASSALADSVPELLHYKFEGTGTSVPNLASSPPTGTATATLMGALTQTGSDLNTGGGGFSLLGTGSSSSSDYLNTGWAPDLGGSPWTISFATSNIISTTLTHYIFGDINSGQLRCFTGGVAGAGNWILRGDSIVDVLVVGGAAMTPRRITFVYDPPLGHIRGYLDGVLVTTVAQGAVFISGGGPFKVGGYAASTNLPANGLMDDFRLYNRALSAAEVAEIDAHPVMQVFGNAVEIQDSDSTPDLADHTDFGDAAVGGGTVTRSFQIVNAGNRDLNLGTAVLGGSEAADFDIATAPSAVVAAGADTVIEITFDPSALGTRTATLEIPSDDPDTPFDFALQGTGLGPDIAVSGNGAGIAACDATPDAADHTDFGGAAVAGGTFTRTFTVENAGNADLTIASVTLGGADAADFGIVTMPGSPLPAGSSSSFQVQFDPSAAGARAASVTIASDDPDENPFVFAIGGTGLVPEIEISGNGVDIADGDATPGAGDDTDFGTTAVVGGVVVRSFVIANSGDADLSIAQPVIGGGAAADFTLSVAPAATIAPGNSTTLALSFDPSASGLREATVSIANGDADEDPFTFSVQGTGASADVQASKSNGVDAVYPGLDTVYTIQVLNAGPVPVSGVRIVDDVDAAQFTDAQWTCTSTPAGLCPNASGGPDIDQTTGALASGAMLEYTLIATPTPTSGGVSNTVTASNLDGDDPNTQNNSATDQDGILPDMIFRDGFEDPQAPLLRASIAR